MVIASHFSYLYYDETTWILHTQLHNKEISRVGNAVICKYSF